MGKVIRYFGMSWVSSLAFLTTLGLLVWHIITRTDVSIFLVIILAYIFHAVMWRGQYIDEIERLRDLNDELYSENIRLRRNVNT